MKRRGIKLKTRKLISIILGCVGFMLIFFIGWEIIGYDSYAKIKAVETAIEREFKKDPEPYWGTIQEITDSLCLKNQEITEAKALLRYKENPIIIHLHYYEHFRIFSAERLWDHRFKNSKQYWRTLSFKILTCFGMATPVFVGLAISTFLLLTIVSWLISWLPQSWDSFLDEINTSSQVIQKGTGETAQVIQKRSGELSQAVQKRSGELSKAIQGKRNRCPEPKKEEEKPNESK